MFGLNHDSDSQESASSLTVSIDWNDNDSVIYNQRELEEYSAITNAQSLLCVVVSYYPKQMGSDSARSSSISLAGLL